MKYDIANAPVKDFRLQVPAAFRNVEVTGAQIRRRDETNGEWRVELQSNVRGEYLLTVTWELPRAGQSNLVEPVRPSVREGKLLLPLERDTASGAPVTVELTFVGQDRFPKRSGTFSLISPKFDLPLKNARWELYLPPDYDYSRFEGSMARTSDTTLPMEQVYSLSEYNVQQQAQAEQSKLEVRSGLESARKDLAGGNLRHPLQLLAGAANRASQTDDYPPAGSEHQGPKLDHPLLPGRNGLCRVVGNRGRTQSAAADGVRMASFSFRGIPAFWSIR